MSTQEPAQENFFSNLLKPGSSLNPTFLLILDGAFATLLVIFIALVYLLAGNLHVIALIGVELCLWASVKWFVNELKCEQSRVNDSQQSEELKKTQ